MGNFTVVYNVYLKFNLNCSFRPNYALNGTSNSFPLRCGDIYDEVLKGGILLFPNLLVLSKIIKGVGRIILRAFWFVPPLMQSRHKLLLLMAICAIKSRWALGPSLCMNKTENCNCITFCTYIN